MKRIEYDKLLEKFVRLPNSKKIDILSDALDEMQYYNGRTINDCIVIAMGGSYTED